MKKIMICHLYYDLMNLYGEHANITAITNILDNLKVDYKVDKLSLNDNIDFKKYDLFYMGMGSENNQLLVLKDILKYKSDIKDAIDNNKIFLMTGNSYELFGKSIDINEALGIFDFESYYKKVNEDQGERIVSEVVYKCAFLDHPVIGFQNRGSINTNNTNNLFEVIRGIGNDLLDIRDNYEGIHFNNFIGTYTVGPILIRNPYLLEYIIKLLIPDYKINKNTPDMYAYLEYLSNYRINKDV